MARNSLSDFKLHTSRRSRRYRQPFTYRLLALVIALRVLLGTLFFAMILLSAFLAAISKP